MSVVVSFVCQHAARRYRELVGAVDRAAAAARHCCHSTDVLQTLVGARFADSGLRGFLTAAGHGVTATERHAPSATDQSARGIWGTNPRRPGPAGGTSNGTVIQPSPYTGMDVSGNPDSCQ
jgi:hypothetical protein